MTDEDSRTRTYRNDAVRLREVMAWNEFDTLQGGSQGLHDPPIVTDSQNPVFAVVDADVVKLFMDPGGETRRVSAFNLSNREPFPADGPLASQSSTTPAPREVESASLTTFAWITAEFLFLSRDNPISLGSDQEAWLWQEAPYIAPDHAEEVSEMIDSIRRGLSTPLPPGPGGAELLTEQVKAARRLVDELADQVAHKSISKKDSDSKADSELASLVNQTTRALDRLFRTETKQQEQSDGEPRGRVLQALRYWDLRRRNQLQPLAVHPLCTTDILRPRSSQVDVWYKPLLIAKEEVNKNRLSLLNQQRRRTEMLKLIAKTARDARVLEQVTALNRCALEAGKGRFILITGDDTVHRVYADLFWEGKLGHDRSAESYILRRPLQYVPVLNARDIPNGVDATNLFRQLAGVLQTFVGFVEQSTSRPIALERDWRLQQVQQQKERQAPAPPIEVESLNKLGELWLRCTDTSSVLCAGFLAKRLESSIVQPLEQVALRPDSRVALVDLLDETFEEIDEIHLPFVFQDLIADADRHRQDAGGVSGVRMPVLFRESFGDLIGARSVEMFVRDFGKNPERERERLKERLHPPQRYLAVFLAGAVAAETNHFDTAVRYLRRARELLEDAQAKLDSAAPDETAVKRDADARRRAIQLRTDRGEIAYLTAVMTRMRMRDRSDYGEARKALLGLIRGRDIPPFETLRAQSGLAALCLMQFENMRFNISGSEKAWSPPSEPLADGDIQLAEPFLSEAGRLLEAARKGLRSLDAGNPNYKPRLSALHTQIHANTLCLALARSGVFDGRYDPLDPAIVSDSLTQLRLLNDDDHIVGLYRRMAEVLDPGSGPEQRDRATALRTFCAGALEGYEAIGPDLYLHSAPLDVKLFQYAMQWAARRIEMLGAATRAPAH